MATARQPAAQAEAIHCQDAKHQALDEANLTQRDPHAATGMRDHVPRVHGVFGRILHSARDWLGSEWHWSAGVSMSLGYCATSERTCADSVTSGADIVKAKAELVQHTLRESPSVLSKLQTFWEVPTVDGRLQTGNERARTELNHEPADLQSAALPLSYTPAAPH